MGKTEIKQELHELVKKLFEEHLEIDDCTRIQGNIDSLAFMGLISEIEDMVTGIRGKPFALTDDVISGENSPLKTMGSLIAYVEEHTKVSKGCI